MKEREFVAKYYTWVIGTGRGQVGKQLSKQLNDKGEQTGRRNSKVRNRVRTKG